MKQVPAGTKVDIDPETGAMKRLSGDTHTNSYDLFALETALQLREKLGGAVTVLTMGPPQAEEMMRDAYMMGADDAVILSDRKFAGADVLATSYALAQGITVLGGADLIICGRQTRSRRRSATSLFCVPASRNMSRRPSASRCRTVSASSPAATAATATSIPRCCVVRR